MSEKRRGLGRGLGALIPTAPPPAKGAGDRPVDVFFPGRTDDDTDAEAQDATDENPSSGAGADKPRPASKRQSVPSITVEDPALEELVAAAAAEIAAEEAGEAPAASVGTDAKPAAPRPTPVAKSTPKPGPPTVPAQGTKSAETKAEPVEAKAEPPKPAAPAQGDEAADESVKRAEPVKAPVTQDAPAPQATRPVAASSGPELVPVPGAYFAELPVAVITPNPRQPREVFDEEALSELVHSVKEIGVLQPIVVRPLPVTPGTEPTFELIMGERRLRASKVAGLERIPAIVRETQDDDMLRDALLENLHRSELNALEEAAAYQQLLDDFGCTHEELASRIGRSRPQISNTIRLLRLPPAVQRRVAAGVLSAGHARALLGLENAESMDKLAQRIVNEGLSVRATEEAVALSDGDTPAAPRRKPRAGGNHAELDDLASRLADRLDTRVNISLGRSKGKLSVEFASVEDLNRILELLAPEVRGAFAKQ